MIRQRKLLFFSCVINLLLLSYIIGVNKENNRKEETKKTENYIHQKNEKKKEIENQDEDEDELKVPFYIYESEKISELWERCYLDKLNKRSGLIFVEQLRYHRWRTFDPEEAAIFVVPIVTMHHDILEEKYFCEEFQDLIHPIINEINQTKYYQKMLGRDHIMVDTWWRSTEISFTYDFRKFFSSIIVGSYGTKKQQKNCYYFLNLKKMLKKKFIVGVKRTFVDGFVESGLYYKCMVFVPFNPNFIQIINTPIEQREIDFFFLGSVDPWKPYRNKIFSKFPELENKVVRLMDVGSHLNITICPFTNSPMESKQKFLRCKTNYTDLFSDWLENSKISLMIRGHDYHSERLYTTLGYGSINLIFSDYLFETGIPFQCFVPWKEFTLQIKSEKFFKDPQKSLKSIASLTNKQLSHIQEKIFRYQKDVLWNHPESRVAENVLKQAVRKCFSLHWLEEKQLYNYKNYNCKYQDDEDKFGGKIDLTKEIH